MALADDNLSRLRWTGGLKKLALALALLSPLACATPGVDTVPTSSGGVPQIAIQAPIGLPQAKTARLGDQLITALQARGVSLAAMPDAPANYRLQGFCSASGGDGETSIACVWDANTRDGARAHRVVTEDTVRANAAADPWSVVSNETLDRIAASVADKFAAWLPRSPSVTADGGVALPTLRSLGLATGARPPVTVSGVGGAPGDGNEALASAMRGALRAQNIPVTSAGERAFRLAGTVALSDRGARTQGLTIEWTLTDPAGNPRGTITQNNEIPRGALNGPWGDTASASAAAAARRISELLPDR
jgi:hypothetical protein